MTTTVGLLAVAAVCAIVSYIGLVNLIGSALEGWRDEQVYKEFRRRMLRNNINQIILSLCDKDDADLDRALQDSIVEYRVLG